jgi:acyl-CoA thioester hydrolase
MKHENLVKIYHHDTDCYNVVWHGAYLKWFEIGRVELSQLIGIDFLKLDQMGILLPVVELNCRYKSPARLMDEICITTELKELKQTSITFSHTIKNIHTGNVVLNATSTLVTTDNKGKLFKKIPDYLYNKYQESITNLDNKISS